MSSSMAHDLYGVVLQVASAHHQPHGHAFQLVIGELEARTFVVAVVESHAYAQLGELLYHGGELVGDGLQLFGVLRDGDDDHLYGGEFGGQYESVVVGVDHDEGTHQAGGDTP